MSAAPEPVLPTFADGRSYIVTQQLETGRGRELEFTLAPDGRKVWVMLADVEDTPARRDALAVELLRKRRYLRGARLAPPYVQPQETRP